MAEMFNHIFVMEVKCTSVILMKCYTKSRHKGVF